MGNRFINRVLWFLFMFGLWIIIAVEFDISFLKVSTIFDDSLLNTMNKVLINIAYGYCVSFITYFITVIIPNKKRSKIASRIIIKSATDYYNKLVVDFLVLFTCAENNRVDENEYVIAYKKEKLNFKHADYLIKNTSSNSTPDDLINRMRHLKIGYNLFIRNTIDFEQYLSDDSLNIISEIIESNWAYSLSIMIDALSEHNKQYFQDEVLFDEFSKHICSMSKLKNEIKAN